MIFEYEENSFHCEISGVFYYVFILFCPFCLSLGMAVHVIIYSFISISI
jgi:hypothetical protein